MLGEILKYLTPVFIFYYINKLFNSENDLHGILITFLISSIFPLLVLLYEFIFSPIDPQFVSRGRVGGARSSGFYADLFTYAIYLTGLFLINGYFYFRKQIYGIKTTTINPILLLVVIFIGLISIKHVASWFAMGSLLLLFGLLQLRSRKGIVMVLFLFGILLPVISQTIYETQIDPLIRKEFVVMEGRAPVERAFNGRMYRWLNYYDWWLNMNTFSQVFGVSSSGFEKANVMVTGNTHNDFIRLFFLTGFPGLILYLAFLITITRFALRLPRDKMFLIIGAVFTVVLYSLSSLPTLYSSLLYLIIPIFVHALSFSKVTSLNAAQTQNINFRQAPAPVLRSGYSNEDNIKL